MWGAGGNMNDPRPKPARWHAHSYGRARGGTNEYGVFDMVGNLHEVGRAIPTARFRVDTTSIPISMGMVVTIERLRIRCPITTTPPDFDAAPIFLPDDRQGTRVAFAHARQNGRTPRARHPPDSHTAARERDASRVLAARLRVIRMDKARSGAGARTGD